MTLLGFRVEIRFGNLNETTDKLKINMEEWNWIFYLTVISSLQLRCEVQDSGLGRSLHFYTKYEIGGYIMATSFSELISRHVHFLKKLK